jgi:hypothetical protein
VTFGEGWRIESAEYKSVNTIVNPKYNISQTNKNGSIKLEDIMPDVISTFRPLEERTNLFNRAALTFLSCLNVQPTHDPDNVRV